MQEQVTTTTSSSTILEAAQECVSQGWVPTPLHAVGPDGVTCSCSKGARCGSAGKHNILKGWESDLRGVAAFEEVFAKRRRANIGILTGSPSGFFVLDVDPGSGGFESMKRLRAEHGQMPRTRIVKTGSGGFHYYFALPDFDVTNRNKPLTAAGYVGLDIRGTGGQVVAPPSVSAKGSYSVQMDEEIAQAPDWLLDMLRPAPAAPLPATYPTPVTVTEEQLTHNEGDLLSKLREDMTQAAKTLDQPSRVQTPREAAYERSIVNGELARVANLKAAGWDAPWDTTTFEVACQMVELANAGWSALTLAEAHDQFIEHCPPTEPGYEPEVKWESAVSRVGSKARPGPVDRPPIDAFFESGGGAEPAGPSEGGGADRQDAPAARLPNLTDVGNANRLVAFAGDRLRWASDAQQWLAYDGKAWTDLGAQTVVKRLSIEMIDHARRVEGPQHSAMPDEFFADGKPKASPRERFFDWMAKSEMDARLNAMASVAEADPRIHAQMDTFSVNPGLLNAQNGVVDLRTGEMRPHDPALMLNTIARANYDPNAKAPKFMAFLERVQPDPEMRSYLQEVVGYSATGEMGEQAFFLHYGSGANGKSVFLEVVRTVMGNMGHKVARDTLYTKQGASGGIGSDIAAMLGKRMMTASETAAGRKLDDERIKELVSGETQRARHLYRSEFEFIPTGKIHLATNHLPPMESGGHGMARRLRVIQWGVQIPTLEQVRGLDRTIVEEEADGVLAWIVEGARRWYARGFLVTPQRVIARTEEHVEDADPVWPFIHDRLIADEEAETEFDAIVGAYTSWCQMKNIRAMSGPALSAALVERMGETARFKHSRTRRSMFRIRVALQAVPAHHDQFFQQGTLGMQQVR